MLQVAEAVSQVRARLGGLTRTSWVGIDGLGASGKSTFAARLARELPGSTVIGVDEFARPGVGTWDHDAFTALVLEPLLAGRPARWPAWDPVAERELGERTALAGTPVLLEGVSATDDALDVPWDVRLWLETAERTRYRRARERDGERVWEERWLAAWIPSEQAYLAAQRPDLRADLVVAGG